MSYQALYRTYRPQQFKDIVGQEVIVRTLQQAIKNNKISHAYLFSGPRGTGKTSVARILAKAINCAHAIIGEPCQECSHCLDITKGNHPDVIEIDAASNNGVDEIRDIRDKVKFLPGLLKYKVYIIDEVHMLSQGAFNALLKTLEEPPKHVVFILATTEPHKIPPTILSRCQRFDFKALSVAGIVKKLNEVVEEENIDITKESISTIAENAEGGMRDALSILDQAISFSESTIGVDEVNAVTGAVSTDIIISLAQSFEKADITSALNMVAELLDLGKEATKLVNNLLQFYRDCLLYKNADVKYLNKYIFEKDSFKNLAKNLSEEKIFYYVNILSDVSYKIRFSNNPRIYLEVALIKMINLDDATLDSVNRIQELEHKVEALALGGVGSSGEPGLVDGDKLSVIELRLNKVINELTKLELHKYTEKVDSLESAISNLKDAKTRSDINADLDFQNQLSQVNIDLAALREELNRFDEKKINDLEIQFLNLRNSLQDVSKNHIVENTFESDESMVERVEDLEDKLYKLIAGTLQTQSASVFGRSTRKNSKQITLFGDNIINIEDLKHPDRESDDSIVLDNEVVINPIKYVQNEEKAEAISEVEQSEIVEDQSEENDLLEEELGNANIEDEVDAGSEETVKDENNATIDAYSVVSGDIKEVKFNDRLSKRTKKPSGAFSTYDARIIERILHDSRTEESRKDRDAINHLWKNLDRGIDPSLISTAEILKESIVGAVGNKEIILVFDDATTVNQVMRPRFKSLAKRVFDHALSIDINYYMALPKDTWVEKRTEYINQYNIGIKYPTLQPIINPHLYEVDEDDEFIDERQKTIDKTIEIFGHDLVKVE